MKNLLKRKVISIWDAERLGYPAASLPNFKQENTIPQPRSGIPFPLGRGFDISVAPTPALVQFDDPILLPDGSIVTDDHYIFHGLTFVPKGRPWTRFAPYVEHSDNDMATIRIPGEILVSGESLYQSVTGHVNNFAHFMHDLMPRLFFTAFTNQVLPDSYKYICKMPAFPIQALVYQSVLGADRILWQGSNSVRAKRCAVAALPISSEGVLKDSVLYAHALLANKFSTIPHAVPKQRIYISRIDGVSTYGRSIVNEDELTRFLLSQGFESIVLSMNDPIDTISRFASAECVVGLHGAGLMNYMFCPAPTKVVELYVPHTTTPWIARMGCLVGHDYSVYSLNRENETTRVDIPDFQAALARVFVT